VGHLTLGKMKSGSRVFLSMLAFSALLLLLPVNTQAHFIIEFTDGTRIIVSNYKEVDRAVKVYTKEGWFAFLKNDITKIIDTNPHKGRRSLDTPAETKLTSPSEVKQKAEHQQQLALAQQALEQEQARQTKDHLQEVKTQSTSTLLKEALSQLLTIPDLQDLYQRAKAGLFGLRYIFALLLGIKVLKIFFSASIR